MHCILGDRHSLYLEFAKEAMSQQALDANEILSIRWAHDDPNPVAQDAISRADKDALAALVRARGISLQTAPFEYPSTYQLPVPEAKRARIEGGDGSGSSDDVLASSELAHVAYPDTDAQYAQYGAYYYAQQHAAGAGAAGAIAADASTSSGGAAEEDSGSTLAVNNEYLNYFKSLTQGGAASEPQVATATAVAAADSSSSSSSSSTPGEAATAAVDPATAASAWTAHVDDDTGATYYYNSATGESSWGPDPTAQ
jgi:hypothetical protein